MLWWDSSGWHYNDLTARTGAPITFRPPDGYVFDAQGTQHVVYGAEDEDQGSWGHIVELWWDSNGWHYNDLTAATGAPLAFSEPAGYVFAAQSTQHVVYLRGLGADGSHGTDGHIVELWWDSDGWHYNEHYNDLTARTGAPLAVGPPTGYAFDAQGTQHVIYRAAHGQQRDGYIVELWWDSNGWHYHRSRWRTISDRSNGGPADWICVRRPRYAACRLPRA